MVERLFEEFLLEVSLIYEITNFLLKGHFSLIVPRQLYSHGCGIEHLAPSVFCFSVCLCCKRETAGAIDTEHCRSI